MGTYTVQVVLRVVFLFLLLFSAVKAVSGPLDVIVSDNTDNPTAANNIEIDVMVLEPFAKAPPQWRNARSPVTVDLKDVLWANGQYIAVGAGGAILSSLNGEFWVEQRSGTTQTIRSVAYNGSRQWIAVGNNGTILRSSNASIWTAVPDVTQEVLFDVLWDGQKFVVAGGAGVIMTSIDGLDWELHSSNTSNSLQGLSVHDGQLIAVGFGAGTILSSTDGHQWIKETPGAKFFFNLVSVNWVGDQFMAVGWDEKIVASHDGVNWRLDKTISTSAYLNTVIKLHDQYIAAGTDGLMLISVDGTNWERQVIPTDEDIWGLAGSAPHRVAVGSKGTILVLSSS